MPRSFRFILSLVSLLLIAYPELGSAVVGKTCSHPPQRNPVCYLSFAAKSADHVDLEECSGTVTMIRGEQVIVTSAHCEAVVRAQSQDISVEATCGPSNQKVEIDGLTQSPAGGAFKAGIYLKDIAILKLKHPIAYVDPAILPADGGEIDNLIKGNDCCIWGYGPNNEGRAGDLSGSQAVFKSRADALKIEQLRSENGKKFELVYKYTDAHEIFLGLPSALGKGDSGGPVLCKAKNSWVILGTGSDSLDSDAVISSYEPVKSWIEWLNRQVEDRKVTPIPDGGRR